MFRQACTPGTSAPLMPSSATRWPEVSLAMGMSYLRMAWANDSNWSALMMPDGRRVTMAYESAPRWAMAPLGAGWALSFLMMLMGVFSVRMAFGRRAIAAWLPRGFLRCAARSSTSTGRGKAS